MSKAGGFILKQSKIILPVLIVVVASILPTTPLRTYSVIMSQASFMLITASA